MRIRFDAVWRALPLALAALTSAFISCRVIQTKTVHKRLRTLESRTIPMKPKVRLALQVATKGKLLVFRISGTRVTGTERIERFRARIIERKSTGDLRPIWKSVPTGVVGLALSPVLVLIDWAQTGDQALGTKTITKRTPHTKRTRFDPNGSLVLHARGRSSDITISVVGGKASLPKSRLAGMNLAGLQFRSRQGGATTFAPRLVNRHLPCPRVGRLRGSFVSTCGGTVKLAAIQRAVARGDFSGRNRVASAAAGRYCTCLFLRYSSFPKGAAILLKYSNNYCQMDVSFVSRMVTVADKNAHCYRLKPY